MLEGLLYGTLLYGGVSFYMTSLLFADVGVTGGETMKIFKNVLLLFALVMALGGEASAEEALNQNKDGKQIFEECRAVMSAKKVLVEEEYLSSEGETVRVLTAGVDLNTGVSYVDLFGFAQVYTDSTSGYEYAFAIGSDGWEVGPPDSDTETDVDAGMEETFVSAQYRGTDNYHDVLGRDTNCDIVEVVLQDQDGQQGNYTYYINAQTREVVTAIGKDEDMQLEMVFSYPDAITIPADIVANAVIANGATVEINGITYLAIQKDEGSRKRVLSVLKGPKQTSVTIPDTEVYHNKAYRVTGIESNAFAKNKRLKKITIGSNVTTIGNRAFYKCKNLKKVSIKSQKLKKVGSKAFYGNAKKLYVSVPGHKKKLREKYQKLIAKAKTNSKIIAK